MRICSYPPEADPENFHELNCVHSVRLLSSERGQQDFGSRQKRPLTRWRSFHGGGDPENFTELASADVVGLTNFGTVLIRQTDGGS